MGERRYRSQCAGAGGGGLALWRMAMMMEPAVLESSSRGWYWEVPEECNLQAVGRVIDQDVCSRAMQTHLSYKAMKAAGTGLALGP